MNDRRPPLAVTELGLQVRPRILRLCVYSLGGGFHPPRRGASGAARQRTSLMNDPYDLRRFIDAQNPVFDEVCAELRAGRKRGHWMWFVFPQLRGLGHSWMANRYGISSRKEAEAYLGNSILGPRLSECTRLICNIEGRSIEQIFGDPDDLKFRSCMTLFGHLAGDNQVFAEALQKYFGGQPDRLTLERLSQSNG